MEGCSKALRISQLSSMAASLDGVGEVEIEDMPELGSCRSACRRDRKPALMVEVVGGMCSVGAVISEGEMVRRRLRGLIGSYSHLRPRSTQRSHEGRSSLHFFFFSLLLVGVVSDFLRTRVRPRRLVLTNERILQNPASQSPARWSLVQHTRMQDEERGDLAYLLWTVASVASPVSAWRRAA